MATQAQINAAKATIDTDITNKTGDASITKVNVGGNMKAVADLSLSPYKSYVAQISQTGTSAPTVEQLFENGLGGTPVWARTGVGAYTLTITGAFVVNKTITFPRDISLVVSVPDEFANAVSINRTDANVVSVETFANGVSTDSILNSFPLEIRVYN